MTVLLTKKELRQLNLEDRQQMMREKFLNREKRLIDKKMSELRRRKKILNKSLFE